VAGKEAGNEDKAKLGGGMENGVPTQALHREVPAAATAVAAAAAQKGGDEGNGDMDDLD
jgi:hypothetical protein